MKQIILTTVLVLSVLGTACGGGGGGGPDPGGIVGGGPGGSGLLAADFTPTQPSPGNNAVALGKSSSSTNHVTLGVNVSGVFDVFGASFDVTYDPSKFEYVGWQAGGLLESAGHSPVYVVSPGTGRIVVGVAGEGGRAPVDVTSPQTLVRLTFRATTEGNSLVAFEGASLLDGQVSIPNLTWYGGALLAN